MAGVRNTIGEITQPAKIRVTVMNGRHKMIITASRFLPYDCSIVRRRLHFRAYGARSVAIYNIYNKLGILSADTSP